jgi:hypothetical protein
MNLMIAPLVARRLVFRGGRIWSFGDIDTSETGKCGYLATDSMEEII